MGSEIYHHSFLPFAEDQAVSESAHSGADFDRPSTRVVHNAILKGPAVGTPDPVCDRAVDEGSPEENEDHHWHNASSLSNGAHDDGGCGSAELHLIGL